MTTDSWIYMCFEVTSTLRCHYHNIIVTVIFGLLSKQTQTHHTTATLFVLTREYIKNVEYVGSKRPSLTCSKSCRLLPVGRHEYCDIDYSLSWPQMNKTLDHFAVVRPTSAEASERCSLWQRTAVADDRRHSCYWSIQALIPQTVGHITRLLHRKNLFFLLAN